MASPSDNDPALQRFRRGAGTRVGPPGPPPVPGAYQPPVPSPLQPSSLQPSPLQAPPLQPIAAGTAPAGAGGQDPAHPLFGDLLGAPPTTADPTSGAWAQASDDAWLPVSDDPGRRSGVTSIAVGIFVGIVGLFIGVHSIRRSRAVGLSGAVGAVGVVVSALSLVIVGAVGLSWVRYEVQVAHQCALLGPGQYLTQSGTAVTCR